MKPPRFATLFSQLPLPNQLHRLQVFDMLHPADGLGRVIALIEAIRAPERRCPHCGSARCHRHGHANDLQRFRCCACGRTFIDLTGTPLARLRLKAKWPDYCEALLDAKPVRAAADRVGVHRNTAFRWRHRFLDQVKHDRPQQLNGIIEVDETYTLELPKGARTRDRAARKRDGKTSGA